MEKIQLKKPKGLNSFTLRVVAVSAMLCDHLWVTLATQSIWLHFLGRLAFPIFSFLLVEGFFYTSNRWHYATRLFVFAALSELPFNLMHAGRFAYVGHQNVLWTFLIGLLAMVTIESIKTRVHNVVITGISTAIVAYMGMYLADSLHTDYAGFGVLTILLFYTCRNLRYEWMGQLLGLIYINAALLSSQTIPLSFWNATLAFPIQSLAVLSLVFIRKYNGLPGFHNKAEQYFFYIFYPAHMLILALLAMNGIAFVL
ncbi:MAG: conjugal transfer protein TraX [Clostridia bacterium]|nr:conjugal transfer protein TraX [Clostridia bacterium]